jgi:hypothetical protein
MYGLDLNPAHMYRSIGINRKEPNMIDKKPRKTMEFNEQDEDFVKQLAKDIGCHYSKANVRTYNLNKFEADAQGDLGIFAWVHKEESDYFWVATRKIWVEKAKARLLANKKTAGLNLFPRDIQHAEDSVHFDMRGDYLKTVRVLNLINTTI